MNFVQSFHPFLGAGDFSDVFLEETESLSILWEEGDVQNISRSRERGAGLRILNGLETRFVHSSLAAPLSGFSGGEERGRLECMFREISGDLRKISPARAALPSIKIYPRQDSPIDHSLDEKVGLLRKAHEAAQAAGGVRQITGNYLEKIKRVGYVNSDGDVFLEERVYLVFNLFVTAWRDRAVQLAYDSMGGVTGFELFRNNSVETLAREVGARALAKLDAPPAPAGEMPVVICSSAGGTLIHEAVGHSLEADLVLQGTSPAFAGKIGQVVANEKVTVADDPTLAAARGSYHSDDEGRPAEKTILIQNGVLKDYLFDRKSASQLKRPSNGHGRRESFAHRPIPRMSNTFIAPGSDVPAEIIRSVPNGFLVTKMGGGQVNTANSDFVFDVEEGFLLKDGKKTLVRGAALLGNGKDVLRSIDMVGSDLGWAIGTCGKEGQGVPVSDGMPTVRIKKLIIGGQSAS